MDDERRVYPHGAVAIAGRDLVAVGPEREVVPRFRAATAAAAVGIRASLADPFVWDVAPPNPAASDRIPLDRARALSVLGTQLKRNADPTALVQGHVAVVGHGTVSDELELAAKACA